MNKCTLSIATLTVSIFATSAHAAGISGQGTWESTLQGRDLDGNLATFEAYYDTTLNITWLADANYAYIQTSWSNANTWAAGLDPYGSGITGWRLPKTVDVGNDGATYTSIYQGVDFGYNITTHSEMSHLFYVTLGNTARYDTSGTATGCAPNYCLSNTGPFSNVQSYIYWSATEYAPNAGSAWRFSFPSGRQDIDWKIEDYHAWAVRAGDVGEVPVPAAVWLFGSGLLGLIGLARKRRS